jgi:hypothetical protein
VKAKRNPFGRVRVNGPTEESAPKHLNRPDIRFAIQPENATLTGLPIVPSRPKPLHCLCTRNARYCSRKRCFQYRHAGFRCGPGDNMVIDDVPV